MENNRYQHGLDQLKSMGFKDNQNPFLSLGETFKDIAPDLDKYVVEFAFGDIYSRTGLDNKQQTLVTISALVALGTEPQLELHVNTGLTVGLTPEEIAGCIMHLIPYAGFPRVLNALKIAKKVFEERGVLA